VKKSSLTGILVAGTILIAFLNAEALERKSLPSFPFDRPAISQVFADDAAYPYGRSKRGRYGEKRSVMNEDEARTILKEHFRDTFSIGKIRKRKFYFETEIRDRNGNLVDKVIIDRRSGRIRSIY
jgi:hypothetical protein